MACRIYPFALVPAGDHWRVGLRFSCPSAAANDGRPLPDHAADLREYAGLLEADAPLPKDAPPPELAPGQAVAWPDLLRFVKTIADVLAEPGTPIDYRLRKVVALASLCKKSKFDKVSGPRLKEFLDVVTAALGDDVVARAEDVPPPGWIGRVIFRQTLAVYSRKDHGPTPGIAKHSRLTRIKSAWRFAMGVGPIPKLHGLMPETTFADAELPAGPLSKESDALLTRYYRVKVESLAVLRAGQLPPGVLGRAGLAVADVPGDPVAEPGTDHTRPSAGRGGESGGADRGRQLRVQQAARLRPAVVGDADVGGARRVGEADRVV